MKDFRPRSLEIGLHLEMGLPIIVVVAVVAWWCLGLLLPPISASGQSSSTTCPQYDAFWKHVYAPSRLAVQVKCVSVTGVIVDATGGKEKDGLRHEADGDCHGWLKLDNAKVGTGLICAANMCSESYLDAGNKSNEGGNLVFENVCMFPVTQADAKAACLNWHSPIKIPPVGSHVRMTGTWVIDQKHAKWSEVHPVMSVEVVK